MRAPRAPGLRLPSLLVAVGLVASAACQRDRGAELDRIRLLERLHDDMIVAEAMHQADQLVVQRKGLEALVLLEHEAEPRARVNAETAEREPLVSPWGKTQGAEVKQLLSDRRSAVESYVAAIKSDDAEKVVSVLESQKALEQRAASLSGSIEATRGARGGCGGGGLGGWRSSVSTATSTRTSITCGSSGGSRPTASRPTRETSPSWPAPPKSGG